MKPNERSIANFFATRIAVRSETLVSLAVSLPDLVPSNYATKPKCEFSIRWQVAI